LDEARSLMEAKGNLIEVARIDALALTLA
jgi:hypothetical protein